MKTAYPILQSGFIAGSEAGLSKIPQPKEEKIIKAIELGKPFDSDGNPFFYDVELDKLYQEYDKDNRLIRSFEFRERLLIAVKNSFKTGRIGDWFSFQELSPYFSSLHCKFINDTANFILSGRREISIQSWQGLIYPSLKTQSDYGLAFNDNAKFMVEQGNYNLSFTIARWTAQQNGWQDLITFAGIVFTAQTSRVV